MAKRRIISKTNYKKRKEEELIVMKTKQILIKDKQNNSIMRLLDFCVEKFRNKESNVLPFDVDGVFKNVLDENDYCIVDDSGNVFFIDNNKYEVCVE